MYQGPFTINEHPYSIDELKTENIYSIVAFTGTGRTTSLLKMAISLCEVGRHVIYVNITDRVDYIKDIVVNLTSDVDVIKDKFHYISASYECILSDLLAKVNDTFSSDILNGSILMVDDLAVIMTENPTDLQSNNMYNKVCAIREFCNKNGIIPIVATQACHGWNQEYPDDIDEFTYAGLQHEKRCRVRAYDYRFHTKVLIKKDQPNEND